MDVTRQIEADPLASGFIFLEGPRWHAGALWMSDMRAGQVLRMDAQGQTETVLAVPGDPSGLGFMPDGSLLVVSMQDQRLLRLEGSTVVEHADLRGLSRGPINDMVADALGRAYVGCFGFDLFGGAAFAPGNLVAVEPDGTARVVAEDLAFPNGTVITDDGRTLVVAETRGACLTAFDIGPDGDLANRRSFAELPGARPDGICLDQDGAIWVSDFGGGCFLRVLEGGAVTDRIDLPGRAAVACQLGGADGRTLFCLVTEENGKGMVERRSRSLVMTARVPVAAAGWPCDPDRDQASSSASQ